MTDCNTSLELLNAYVDGESTPPEELELRRHLDACETCRRQVETLLALKAAVAASAEMRPVPHTLRARLGPLASRSTRRYVRRRRWLAGLAAAVLIAVGVSGWFMLRPQAKADLLTEALVARHLYFLHDPHAVEITSHDPQRIVAWFSNKVAFPVRLPTLNGADLKGARFCHFWGHKIALAFYEAHGKRLSLFVTDSTTFPFGTRQTPSCRTALGDYEVCIVPTASTVLALVGGKEEMVGTLRDLETLARQYPPS
jgi:anti-sigma factor (TIGR02949 family)